MIRNPLTGTEDKPTLDEQEKFLCECNLCGIEFGELSGCGSFYVTNQRILWIKSKESESCYSFCTSLSSLMVHALCKDYLFLQIENQEHEIKIMHKSYDELQRVYEALCEGQRLNPCEVDSSDGNDSACNSSNYDDYEAKSKESEKKNDAKTSQLINEWESKLIISNNADMINNDGYLEKAKDGQFDDAENEKNPYLDSSLMDGLGQFAPEQNKSFEDKFKTHKEFNPEPVDTKDQQKSEQ